MSTRSKAFIRPTPLGKQLFIERCEMSNKQPYKLGGWFEECQSCGKKKRSNFTNPLCANCMKN